jgi:DNA-binding NarL/FixJ family response regulator
MPQVIPMRYHEPRMLSVGADTLEAVLGVCVEALAALAQTHGDREHALRLRQAAALLRPANDWQTVQHADLTPRELEVARLVARGCSNREIACELVVSARTVDAHVSNILRKLGLARRAQIATWATLTLHRRVNGVARR